jgi:hypothetical protein
MIEKLEADNARLLQENDAFRRSLERIRDYPNAAYNHTPGCELHKVDPEDLDDELCDCGYWSASFPMLKIEALMTLKAAGYLPAGANG